MEQEDEIRERVLREFNASTLDDVGPLTTLYGISLQSGVGYRSGLTYGTTIVADHELEHAMEFEVRDV